MNNKGIQFQDTDPHANMIGGTLTWGEIPSDSIGKVEEWAFYLSLDGESASTTAIFTVDVGETSYQILEGTDVGFNRYFMMYGRNGGGDGETFSLAPFVHKCDICIPMFEFENESAHNYHIRGDVKFNSMKQDLISHYNIYIGHDPFAADALVAPIKKVEKKVETGYIVNIPELNVNGMPYIWIRSFYEDGALDDTPTGDLQYAKIAYYSGQRDPVLSAERDVPNLGGIRR